MKDYTELLEWLDGSSKTTSKVWNEEIGTHLSEAAAAIRELQKASKILDEVAHRHLWSPHFEGPCLCEPHTEWRNMRNGET